MNDPPVLLSHGHIDHKGAIAHHAARRAAMHMAEGTCLVPRSIAHEVEALFAAVRVLKNGA